MPPALHFFVNYLLNGYSPFCLLFPLWSGYHRANARCNRTSPLWWLFRISFKWYLFILFSRLDILDSKSRSFRWKSKYVCVGEKIIEHNSMVLWWWHLLQWLGILALILGSSTNTSEFLWISTSTIECSQFVKNSYGFCDDVSDNLYSTMTSSMDRY